MAKRSPAPFRPQPSPQPREPPLVLVGSVCCGDNTVFVASGSPSRYTLLCPLSPWRRRKELQSLCKERGIKANGKTLVLLRQLKVVPSLLGSPVFVTDLLHSTFPAHLPRSERGPKIQVAGVCCFQSRSSRGGLPSQLIIHTSTRFRNPPVHPPHGVSAPLLRSLPSGDVDPPFPPARNKKHMTLRFFFPTTWWAPTTRSS